MEGRINVARRVLGCIGWSLGAPQGLVSQSALVAALTYQPGIATAANAAKFAGQAWGSDPRSDEGAERPFIGAGPELSRISCGTITPSSLAVSAL